MRAARSEGVPPTMMPLPAELRASDVAGALDPVMLGATAVLLTLGVCMVYSGSAVLAAERFGSAEHFLLRHLVALGLGLGIVAVILRVPLESWSRMAYPLLILTVVLLALTVLSPWGRAFNGASRWLAFGPIRFQPAELAKLAVPVYLAHSLAKKREDVSSFSVGFLPHVIIVSALAGLILKQPDLGTSALIYAILAAMLFVAGTRLGYLLASGLAALPVVGLYLAYYPHAWRRVMVFLEPEADPQGAGYHIYQSLVAFGSGGPTGMGLGQGHQKLLFLPEPHTDFLFSTLGQELGFVGVVVVLGAFALLIGRSLGVAGRFSCRFPMYLTFGISVSLGLQAILNMGVATALLPTKGLTLPLMSYGRSSLVVAMACVALLLRASAEERVGLRAPEEAKS